MSPLEQSRIREQQLAAALAKIAATCGISLKTPLQIDSRGEFFIVAASPDEVSCGQFGERFAELLNQYRPRTGAGTTATLLPENGWCYLNHFEAEKLVADWN